MGNDLDWVTGAPARVVLQSAAQPAAWLSRMGAAADAGALARSLAVLDTFRRSLPFANLDPLGALGRQTHDAEDPGSDMAGTADPERRRSAAGSAHMPAAGIVEAAHGSSGHQVGSWPRSPGEGSPVPLPAATPATLRLAQLEALASRRGPTVAGVPRAGRAGTPAHGEPAGGARQLSDHRNYHHRSKAHGEPAGGARQAGDADGPAGAARDPAQPRREPAAIPAGVGLLSRLVEPVLAEGAGPGEPAGQAALVRAAISRALGTAVAASRAITPPRPATPGTKNVPWLTGDTLAGWHRGNQGGNQGEVGGAATVVLPDWPGAPPPGASPVIAGNGQQSGVAVPVAHDLRVPPGQRPAPPGLSLLAEILDVFQARQMAGHPAEQVVPVAPDARPVSGEVAPAPAQESTVGLAAPGAAAIQNTFNVTVHMAGGTDAGEEMLAERLTRILIDQARRQGIDI